MPQPETDHAKEISNEADKARAREIIGNVNNYAEDDGELSISAFGPLAKRIAEALTTARQEERKATLRNVAQRLRDRAEEWRLAAERWQRNAEAAGMDIIRDQDYADRDACLSKMSAATTLATEFDEASTSEGRSSDE
jgi:hypothetical protein